MKIKKTASSLMTAALAAAMILAVSAPASAQARGLRAIRAADMRKNLEFLAAPEFAGRPAPSP
jgi:hypothetical protein